ncbi:MAG: tetratricopeptide repeat protein [Bacteroidia bacterium]|nr:tetratricopeptide repeat protein [Bacteroidia bacterium]MBP7260211.1 tetratricopeptide repeat protein [Bacteroidia bacterium]MBP9179824.1 tetratricopeptide repeat protein [Bacteroidia bacterium]MBP9723823.1 tetratricopeptide repeat protein [Bacteroidia bacterium]
MYNRILTFLLLISSIPSYAADIYATDTNAILTKLSRSMQLQRTNPDSSYLLAQQGLSLSQKANYPKGIASAYMRIGSMMSATGKNDSALLLVSQVITIRKQLQDYTGVAGACVLMSYIYQSEGKLDSAFGYLHKAIKFNAIAKDSHNMVLNYVNLGNLIRDYNYPENALTHYQKAYELATACHYGEGIVYATDGLGGYYSNKKDYKRAYFYYHQIDSITQITKDVISNAQNKGNLANCKEKLGEVKLAKVFYLQAVDAFTKLNLIEDLCETYMNLGNTYLNNKQVSEAIDYFHKAEKGIQSYGNLQQMANNQQNLAKAYYLKKDFEQAFQYAQKYNTLSDSLLNKEKVLSIAEMQTKYETEKKEQQITLLDAQGKTRTAQRNFFIAGSAVLLTSLLALGLYYVQRNKLAKKNAQIAEQKIETLLNETELKTYNAMIEGQDEERKRISTDLHDRLGSMLATVKLLFGALDNKIDKAQEENNKQYEKANQLLDEACSEVRRISHNLSTGMVMSFGLVPALQELCDSVEQSGLINCRLMTYGMDERLDQSIETGVYRIVQELFSNILKHAKAQHIIVQLNHVEGSLNITVEDDGVGFNVEEKKQSGGMGLKNLSKRATQLNGLYTVDSHPGKGTISIIEIPIIKDNT